MARLYNQPGTVTNSVKILHICKDYPYESQTPRTSAPVHPRNELLELRVTRNNPDFTYSRRNTRTAHITLVNETFTSITFFLTHLIHPSRLPDCPGTTLKAGRNVLGLPPRRRELAFDELQLTRQLLAL